MIQKMNRKEAFPESWEQFAEMIKSFEYAGVVDSQSVQQDAEDQKNSSGNKSALHKHPDEFPVLFGLDRLDHVGETEKTLRR